MKYKLYIIIMVILIFNTVPTFAQEAKTVEVLPPMAKPETTQSDEIEQTDFLTAILYIYLPEISSPYGNFTQNINISKPYKNFRVYFDNTTDYPVTLYIAGPYKYSYETTIEPHSSQTVTINDAYIGEYEINLLAQNGYPLTGDFRVRVSTYPM